MIYRLLLLSYETKCISENIVESNLSYKICLTESLLIEKMLAYRPGVLFLAYFR